MIANLRSFLLAMVFAVQLGQAGDMPHGWAQSARVYRGMGGDMDELMELVGCVLEEPILGGKSFQCGERFIWVGPSGSTRLALGAISNIQVEGDVEEARAFAGTVGTRGAGRVEKGVLFEGQCYGDTGICTILRGQGWEFRVRGNRLELMGPDGMLRQAW